jgi:hypothetical protein
VFSSEPPTNMQQRAARDQQRRQSNGPADGFVVNEEIRCVRQCSSACYTQHSRVNVHTFRRPKADANACSMVYWPHLIGALVGGSCQPRCVRSHTLISSLSYRAEEVRLLGEQKEQLGVMSLDKVRRRLHALP